MTTDTQSSTEPPSRYVVGMDLGTTNSAVAFVDTLQSNWRVEILRVPQLIGPGEVESRETLPSFHYQPADGEFSADALRLPWQSSSARETDAARYIVGTFARDHGAVVPGRLISSAKSWLCHTGVDRAADLLPWHGAADVERLSPVAVSARYLRQVREAWDTQHPQHPLAEQDFVLTLPASFDEVARELTVAAAAAAGLPRVVLIEEPQAAFYAWIHKHADNWEQFVSPGQKILVCDIGGGTTDFTLIRVRSDEHEKVHFHRVAVGDHLILGGDNQDLALAHHLEQRLSPASKLEPRQWDLLVRTCRRVKEKLLGDDSPERMTVNIAAVGSRLFGGLQTEVTRDEVQQLIVEGFLPRVALTDRPATRRSGFQEFGLPYAPDAAMTRYLAAFLTAHRHVTIGDEVLPTDHDPARPDIVLFNGGLFASPVLRDRLMEVLCSWFSNTNQTWRPLVLDHDRLDLAVARGAAYYGMVRRGAGVRIAADLARTYYIGVESDTDLPPNKLAPDVHLAPGEYTGGEYTGGGYIAAQPRSGDDIAGYTQTADLKHTALCLVPASAMAGQEIDLSGREFQLRVAEPVEFPLYISSTRLTDKPGELVVVDPERMTALPPIRTVLKSRGKAEPNAKNADAASSSKINTVAVQLHARLTEIGTLDLWCSEQRGPRTWRMQFDIRSATQTDVDSHTGAGELQGFVDESTASEVRALIEAAFGPTASEKPDTLMKQLARTLASSKQDWPMSLLRRIWESLLDNEPGRRRSPNHEARWLNLLGFSLRPGYGLALDDWRVAETWRALHGKLVHSAALCQNEWWILWRRVAGGLSTGQQRALADPLLAPIRGLHRRLTTGKGGAGDLSFGTKESIEVWRLLGSLELLSATTKLELGRMLLDLLPKPKMAAVRPAIVWTLGRLAARVPVYGPLNVVVPSETANDWVARLLDLSQQDTLEPWAVMQLARRTGDRYRDVSDKQRGKVLDWFAKISAPETLTRLVRDGGELDSEQQARAFGEALPRGLRIM